MQHLQKTRGRTGDPALVGTFQRVFPTYPLSFHTIAHSFAATQNSTLLFSGDSALFGKNTRGGGTSSLLRTLHPIFFLLRTSGYHRALLGIPPSTVLSYRGHYATLSPRPFFPSLPPYLLASILAACSCHSARKPAHHPLRAQSRSCAGLQAYRPRRQTGHSCRFPRQSHPSEFLGHLVRTLPRRNSRPRRAPEQIQGPTPDSRPRGGR